MFKIKINPNEFNQSLDFYKRDLLKAVEEQVRQNIVEPQNWQGDFGKTFRRNGEIVEGSFRNIVYR